MPNIGTNVFEVNVAVDQLDGMKKESLDLSLVQAKFAVAFDLNPYVMQEFVQEKDLFKVSEVATAIIGSVDKPIALNSIQKLCLFKPLLNLSETNEKRLELLKTESPIVYVDWFMPVFWSNWSIGNYCLMSELCDVYEQAGEHKKNEFLDFYSKGVYIKDGSYPIVCHATVNQEKNEVYVGTKYSCMSDGAVRAFVSYLAGLVNTNEIKHIYFSHELGYQGEMRFSISRLANTKYCNCLESSHEELYEDEVA